MSVKTLILHIAHEFGGAEYSLLDILHHISDPKEYMLVLASGTTLHKRIMEEDFTVHAMPFCKLRRKGIWYRSFFQIPAIALISYRLYKVCKKEQIAVIYCNTHKALVYLPRFLFRHFKIVVSCRDNIQSGLERKMIHKRSSRTLAVSEHILRQLSFASADLLYNAVDCSRLIDQYDNLPPSNEASSEVRIVNIGSILPWKNQMDCVALAERIVKHDPSTKFFMIGDIRDEDYYAELVTMIAQKNLSGNVVFTGFTDHPSEVMSSADIVVHTAIGEPFGRVIVEAMLLGKTVVAYRSGGPAEIISDGETGFLIEPGDISGLEECVSNLIANPDLRHDIGQRASQLARSKYDIPDYIKRFEAYIS